MAAGVIDWAARANTGVLVVGTTGTITKHSDNSVHNSDHDTAAYAHCGTAPPDASVTYTITFDETVTIERFYLKVYGDDYVASHKPTFTWAYYSGAWTTIRSFVGTGVIQEFTDIGVVEDVEEVRLVISDYYESGEGVSKSSTYALEAWGHYFDDGAEAGSDLSDGIRVWDGTANINIAVEELDGHRVRIRGSDAVTYGVPLVPITHAKASKVRIYDGEEVKSFVDIA